MGKTIDLEIPMKVTKVIGYDEGKPRKTFNQVMAKAFKSVSNTIVLNEIYNSMYSKVIAQSNLLDVATTPTKSEELILKINEKIF